MSQRQLLQSDIYIALMRFLLMFAVLLLSAGCRFVPGYYDGLESSVTGITSIAVEQGRSCNISIARFSLHYAFSHPWRLPRGVSIKKIAADQAILMAGHIATLGSRGEIASGISVGVVAQTKNHSTNCKTFSMNI